MIYYSIITILLLLTIYEYSVGKPAQDWKDLRYVFIVLAAAVSLITALRYETGQDWSVYKQYFDTCLSVNWSGEFEAGYYALNVVFKKLFNNYYVMQFCISLFSSICIFRYIFRKAERPFLVLLVYFLLLYYFLIDMTVLRQHLAMAIVVLGMNFVEKRKLIPWIIVIVIAMQFHVSALVALPLYVTYNRAINKKTGLIILVGALALDVAGLLFVTNIVKALLSLPFLPERVIRIAEIYLRRSDLAQQVQYNTGFGVLGNYLFYFIIVLMICNEFKDVLLVDYVDKDENKYRVMDKRNVLNFLIGVVFLAAGRNFSVLTRVAYYFLICGNGLNAYSSLAGTTLPKGRIRFTPSSQKAICILIFIAFIGFRLLFFTLSWKTVSNGVQFYSHYIPYKSVLFPGLN